MKLAELEAKAKALAGTQHWRGLDPKVVLEVCAKLAKARTAILAMAQADTDTELVTLAREALKEIEE